MAGSYEMESVPTSPTKLVQYYQNQIVHLEREVKALRSKAKPVSQRRVQKSDELTKAERRLDEVHELHKEALSKISAGHSSSRGKESTAAHFKAGIEGDETSDLSSVPSDAEPDGKDTPKKDTSVRRSTRRGTVGAKGKQVQTVQDVTTKKKTSKTLAKRRQPPVGNPKAHMETTVAAVPVASPKDSTPEPNPSSTTSAITVPEVPPPAPAVSPKDPSPQLDIPSMATKSMPEVAPPITAQDPSSAPAVISSRIPTVDPVPDPARVVPTSTLVDAPTVNHAKTTHTAPPNDVPENVTPQELATLATLDDVPPTVSESKVVVKDGRKSAKQGKTSSKESRKDVPTTQRPKTKVGKKHGDTVDEDDNDDEDEDGDVENGGKKVLVPGRRSINVDSLEGQMVISQYYLWDGADREAFRLKALIAWGAYEGNPDKGIGPKYRAAIRRYAEIVPEAGNFSRKATLYLHTTNRGNIVCLTHEMKDKGGHVYDGGAKQFEGALLTGVPGERRMRTKRGDEDTPEPEPGHVHCGCTEDSLIFGFYMFKMGRIRGVVKGQPKEESWRAMDFPPRLRAGIMDTVLQMSNLTSVDELFRFETKNGRHVEVDPTVLLKERIKQMQAKLRILEHPNCPPDVSPEDMENVPSPTAQHGVKRGRNEDESGDDSDGDEVEDGGEQVTTNAKKSKRS